MPENKITPGILKGMKGREPIAALTAYDFPMARLLDEAGVPLILVGDSLGMVVLGYPDTTHVTMADMEHHVRAVARARPRGLVIADLPYHSYDSVDLALENARRLMAAGAEGVKAEGGTEILPQVRAILQAGIPFVGHLGMLPQSVHEEGGYHIKGKVEAEHQQLLADIVSLAGAGATAVVLELVSPAVAREMTTRVGIPTIGIGSGQGCDGQILVTTDLLGTSPDYIPKHVKIRGDLRAQGLQVIKLWRDSLSAVPTPTPGPGPSPRPA
ncbi:MAG TPA: 3-methyl-2-oxobutanoate hydroxymethyltransferase [Verrucomicrobiales bacterium]|nr:3-methyl-2-oxobutanoate hydroxymethyltransferase [Verrucomicrobiales bacterium]